MITPMDNRFTYSAQVTKVVDGDTIDVILDIGFETFTVKRLRFARINAYESRTKNLEEKALGLRAKEYVTFMLEAHPDKVVIQTVEKGKYGKWIAEVWADGTNINDSLVDLGLAVFQEY